MHAYKETNSLNLKRQKWKISVKMNYIMETGKNRTKCQYTSNKGGKKLKKLRNEMIDNHKTIKTEKVNFNNEEGVVKTTSSVSKSEQTLSLPINGPTCQFKIV